MSTTGDQSNVFSGNRANLSDPNSSEQSKQHSKQIVDSISNEGDNSKILAGHKAAVNSKDTSEEVKEHSAKTLEEGGAK